MSEHDNAAFIIAASAVLNATIAGMVAENQQRIQRGESLAYVEDAFEEVIEQSGCHYNQVVELLRGKQV